MNRRDFVKVSTLAGGGLLVSFAIPVLIKRFGKLAIDAYKLNPFLEISENGTIQIILSKVEMGQGIWTTLPMLIAEELDCDWRQIKVEHRSAGKGSDFKEPLFQQATGGSNSTVSEFDRYRMAGATARVMLLNAAANKFGVKPEECRTENGYVLFNDQRVSYAAIAVDASKLPVPSVTLRDAKDWKYIGKSQDRLDIPQKINGQAIFGLDIGFPGLMIATVAHPPVFGAKVQSFNAVKAKAMEGVIDVVQIPTGLAVIAKDFWTAKTARELLEIEWDFGDNKTPDSERLFHEYRNLSQTKGIPFQASGDIESAMHCCHKAIEAEYVFPYLAHAPMEPLNCTVKLNDTAGCEIWAGTQWPLLNQTKVAGLLNCEPEQVTIHTPFLGGSFGRRGSFDCEWVLEAVNIAKASGRNIKLIWSREDDIRGGYYRPAYLHRVIIGINTNGLPLAWQHRIVGQSLFVNTPFEHDIIQNGIDYSSVDGLHRSPYFDSIANYNLELHTTSVGVPVLPWRSVGNTHTAFVMETLIDELAVLAKKDPVEYRRFLLKDHPRHLAALNLVTAKAGWNMPPPAGTFRGLAMHGAMGSIVAQVVELSIQDGKILLHRIICAIDCGLAINPEGVCAQMESGIVFGLTAALYGEITIKDGHVEQSNFHDYPMLRINEMPVIEVYITDSQENMGGAGEPGVPPVAPALANAVFAATGKRVRSLPIRL